MHYFLLCYVAARVGELQRRAHGKPRAAEAWSRLRLGLCRDADDLIVPSLDGFQALCEHLLQLSLADNPKERAEQPPLEVLALAHNDDVHISRPIGLPRE